MTEDHGTVRATASAGTHQPVRRLMIVAVGAVMVVVGAVASWTAWLRVRTHGWNSDDVALQIAVRDWRPFRDELFVPENTYALHVPLDVFVDAVFGAGAPSLTVQTLLLFLTGVWGYFAAVLWSSWHLVPSERPLSGERSRPSHQSAVSSDPILVGLSGDSVADRALAAQLGVPQRGGGVVGGIRCGRHFCVRCDVVGRAAE